MHNFAKTNIRDCFRIRQSTAYRCLLVLSFHRPAQNNFGFAIIKHVYLHHMRKITLVPTGGCRFRMSGGDTCAHH